MRVAATFAAVLLALFATAPGTAQEAPQPSFGETIEVRAVHLEVVVTDRSGARVGGLGPGDFRVLVDGEPVAVDFFAEVAGGGVVPPAEGTVPPAADLPAALSEGRVGNNYLLFVDDFSSLPPDRDRVLRALAADLSLLGPDDRMAVVAFDGRGVALLSGWTDDQDELAAALEEATSRPAMGLARQGELRAHDSLRDRPTSLTRDRLQTPAAEDRMFAHQIERQLGRSVDAAAASLGYLGRPVGRRVALLLTGGWPFSPASYASGGRDVLQVEEPAGIRLLAPLVATANLLGYTLYPIDAPGLGRTPDRDGRALDDWGEAREGADATPELTAANERAQIEHDSLRLVADRTGGRVTPGSRRGVLAAVAEDLGSYYWLGFSPERQRDDRRHEIRVEVARPGLVVRSRRDYTDLSRATERSMALATELLLGAPDGATALEVAVGEALPGEGRNEVRVALAVRIPLDALALVPEPDGQWVAHLQVLAGAVDAKQRESDLPSMPFVLRVPEEPAPGAVYTLQVPLALRRGRQTVVVQVVDELAGTTLSRRLELEL